LKERDHQQHVFLSSEVERLRARVATVDHLERVNRSLGAELRELRALRLENEHQGEVLRGPEVNQRAPLAAISPNKASLPRKRHGQAKAESTPGSNSATLESDHAKLAAKYSALKRSLEDITTRARKFRDERDGWLKYAESLESKVKKLENKIANSSRTPPTRSAANGPNPTEKNEGLVVEEPQAYLAGLDNADSDSSGKSNANTRFRSEPGASVSFPAPSNASSEDPPSPPRAMSTPLDLPSLQSSVDSIPRSNPTAGEGTYVAQATPVLPRLPQSAHLVGSVLIKEEPSSDEPVIVSERNLRKRRHDDTASETPQSRKIKSEHCSSDPVVTGQAHNFSPQESIDLDIRHDAMATPKRRRALLDDDVSQDSASEADDGEGATLVEARWSHSSKRPSLQLPLKTLVEPRGTPLTAVRSSSALIPSTHIPTPTMGGAHALAGRHDSPLDDRIADLAEDDDIPFSHNEPRASIELPAQPAASGSRLDTLLNKPSPGGNVVLLRPNRQARKSLDIEPFDMNIPTRKLPFWKGGRKAASTTPKATEKVDRNQSNPRSVSRLHISETAATKPSNAPSLRRRPLASLQLDDFKINPKFNDGQTFAFSEVVRNKSNRAELPGCTDPQCCGKHFRALAQAELEAAGPSLIHRAADIELLEDYLGEQAYRLGGMTRPEKEELWLEAKTRELANKHGKHRHRFARRQSPPGYWNASFPDTQEMEREREEGERRERKLVEERWREAMRSGGRWLFRDE